MEKQLRPTPARLTDQELVAEVARLARLEQKATAALVAHLVELEGRELHLERGCQSIFDYCRRVLHLSEDAAYNRMKAAHAARRFPVILPLLAQGDLHLTALRQLEPHLTEENHREVLEAARHRSKREVELLVARLAPKPDVPASVRKLHAPKAALAPAELPLRPAVACAASAPTRATRPVVAPLAPGRFKIQFTVGDAFQARLARAQELLGPRVAPGDLAAVFDQALELLVTKLEKQKNGATSRPRSSPRPTRPGSRYVPSALKQAVQAQDGGQCTFVGPDGRRCAARSGLEYHHRHAYAHGGPMTLENVTLRCRTHNASRPRSVSGPGAVPRPCARRRRPMERRSVGRAPLRRSGTASVPSRDDSEAPKDTGGRRGPARSGASPRRTAGWSGPTQADRRTRAPDPFVRAALSSPTSGARCARLRAHHSLIPKRWRRKAHWSASSRMRSERREGPACPPFQLVSSRTGFPSVFTARSLAT